jgi:hypothetical protein
MPSFLNPQLLSPNIPQRQPPKKVVLRNSDVSLQFVLARDTGRNYIIVYLLNIIPNMAQRDPSKILQASNMDMNSLKKAIESKIITRDKKYISIRDFTTRRVTFVFNHNEWLRDAVTDTSSRTTLTRFARDFRLKKQVPLIIMADPMRMPFGNFIIRKFKEYMESKNKEATWFRYLLPESQRSRFRGRVRNMFDWTYDFTWNTITATLKSIYILALMYATGVMVRRMTASDMRSPTNQRMFATKVKQNLKQFDYGKFDRYSRRKGFI